MEGHVLLNIHADPESSDDGYSSDSADSEGLSDSSGELLSSNIGVSYKAIKIDGQRLEDYSLTADYEKVRNKYFTPEIIRHCLLCETHNHKTTITRNKFIVDFTNSDVNHTSGYESFENVIGFRLIKAGVPNRDYHITDATKQLTFTINNASHTATLVPGKYTIASMASHLETKMQDEVAGVTVTHDSATLKFTFAHSSNIGFDFTNDTTNLSNILGFPKAVISESSSVVSTNLPDFSVHYIDIVIDEIPYIACKRKAHGKHVIDRIGLYTSQGALNYYENKQLIYQNYCTPIKLSRLTIELLDDHGNYYDPGEVNCFFEFEITILQRP